MAIYWEDARCEVKDDRPFREAHPGLTAPLHLGLVQVRGSGHEGARANAAPWPRS